jgi:hypothetical protein
MLSTPFADATIVLLMDLAELQLAPAPITLIIVVDIMVHKFGTVNPQQQREHYSLKPKLPCCMSTTMVKINARRFNTTTMTNLLVVLQSSHFGCDVVMGSPIPTLMM